MKSTFLLLAFALCSPVLFGQTQMIKDINPGSNGSIDYADNALCVIDGYLYFIGSTADNGPELWKTNGTATGTQLVKDINPGATGSGLNNFYALGNVLIFTANDGANGVELWRSDGTAAGTVMVKNIRPGSASGIVDYINNPQYYSVYKDKLYFGADDGIAGVELWSSDGTEAGTQLLKDIYVNAGSSFPESFEVHNNILFFSALNFADGRELWKTDGTPAGTMLVKNIAPSWKDSSPKNLRSLGNVLIFTADDDVHDEELWKTDGTAAGTVLVKDIKTNSVGTFSTSAFEVSLNTFENRFARVGDIAFFSAVDDANSVELWKTDGTTAGTELVKDASSATGFDAYAPQNFAVLGNEVFYKYDDDIKGQELWKSDGTALGTKIVKDIYPGSFGSFSLPTFIYPHNNKVYFNADGGTNGIELYESNGTIAGTKLFADINPGFGNSYPSNLISLGKKLIFWAFSPSAGMEPWAYIPPLTMTATVMTALCHGDSTSSIVLQIGANGTPPYTATWTPNWVSGLTPDNLPAGMYSVTVTDAEGSTGSGSFTVNQPTATTLNTSTTPEIGTSANGTATVSPVGGIPPFIYLWNTIPAQHTSTASNLSAGTYTCTVTDANGCTQTATAAVLQTSGTLDKLNAAIGINFQPNPMNTQGQWDVPGESATAGQIIQADGRLLRTLDGVELAKKHLDADRLAPGTYFLMVNLKSGKVAVGTFMVQR